MEKKAIVIEEMLEIDEATVKLLLKEERKITRSKERNLIVLIKEFHTVGATFLNFLRISLRKLRA